MTRLSMEIQRELGKVCVRTDEYLMGARETTPGTYYGSVWSEKGYHGPLLDYHAGGSHHHRGAGSAGFAFWRMSEFLGCAAHRRAGEDAFDWLVARQASRGGFSEIQNNECPSDWEYTGLEELSTIATGFVVHGLGHALLSGLPPKATYMNCLLGAGHWQLSLEWPAGSGVFPHHERSPYNTLNANLHAAETLAVAFAALSEVYGRRLNIFLQGARRAVTRTLTHQWDDGCFPYRDHGGVTINYTSLVLWCLLNVLDVLPPSCSPLVAPPDDVRSAFDRACAFLRGCVTESGALDWEGNETSTAKHNMWTSVITANVLLRVGGDPNVECAERIFRHALSLRTERGLLPMRDRGEAITECAFMQADMLLFMLPFARFRGC